MNKILKCLILFLLISNVAYSQDLYPKILSDSTVVITTQQLKNANKLFYEGQFYKSLHKEDSIKISSYKELVGNYTKIDSLRVNDINSLQGNLNKAIAKNSLYTKIFGGSSLLLAIISLILLIK